MSCARKKMEIQAYVADNLTDPEPIAETFLPARMEACETFRRGNLKADLERKRLW